MDLAAKIAEEVFQTFEREQRLVKADIVEAVTKVLAVWEKAAHPLVCGAIPDLPEQVSFYPGAVAAAALEIAAAPEVLTCDEFVARMKQRCPRPEYRERWFELEKYETRASDVILLDPLVMFVDRSEERGINGRLLHPPRVYVIHYCEEMDEIQLAPMDSRAGQELKPATMQQMWQLVRDLRDKRDDELRKLVSYA